MKKERKQKKKRGGRGRIRETDDYEEAKEKFPEIAKEIDELDYQVDMVGDIGCKFRYRYKISSFFALKMIFFLEKWKKRTTGWQLMSF